MKLSDKILYVICIVAIVLSIYTIYRTDTAITNAVESCNQYWKGIYNITEVPTTNLPTINIGDIDAYKSNSHNTKEPSP